MRRIIVTIEDMELGMFVTESIELVHDDLVNNPSKLIYMIHGLEEKLDIIKIEKNDKQV